MGRILVWCGLTAVSCLLFFLFFPFTMQAQTVEPTPDRLAPPPTVPSPTQADEGAQLYWLHCQPCHGDRGQGLTDAPDDDWRAQYPPEDGYCWDSGCHGERPYEDGFTIPKQVPAIIGEDSLTRFATLGDMFAFVQAAMPFQVPNSLNDEEYLQIIAFLARENGVSDRQLTMTDLPTIQLHETYNEISSTSLPTAEPSINVLANEALSEAKFRWLWLGGLVVISLIIGGLLWLRYGR